MLEFVVVVVSDIEMTAIAEIEIDAEYKVDYDNKSSDNYIIFVQNFRAQVNYEDSIHHHITFQSSP